MKWTEIFRAWLRSWITPAPAPVRPTRSLAQLEMEFARAKKLHRPRRHIEQAMRNIRAAGLRNEVKGVRHARQ